MKPMRKAVLAFLDHVSNLLIFLALLAGAVWVLVESIKRGFGPYVVGSLFLIAVLSPGIEKARKAYEKAKKEE